MSAVRWLLQQGLTFDCQLILQAARFGRVDILQPAHSVRVPITADMITEAISHKNWEVLVWASKWRAC